MKAIVNGDFKKEVVKVKKQKKKLSLMELVIKNIPKDRYKGLIDILEPHEIPEIR